ncbi:MAG: PD-(D/E)XK nuclease family protein [Candidatus Melainabacteria bacterium]|nr:PD-(D/E)XK nuclease family protein [Candidatus Melainabacteria bacterium]
MELHITFGWHLDGPSYPESTAVGALAVGPIGMLSQLCLRLGLTARFPAQSVRIAEFMSRLREHDDGSQFYSQSFKTDSWGTAKALLFLRDELIGNGWNPNRDSAASPASVSPAAPSLETASLESQPIEILQLETPPRLKTLAELSQLHETPERNSNLVCLGDMINPIFERLTLVDRIAIDRITLIDEENLLPPVWQKLFSTLREKGVVVEQWLGSVSKGNNKRSEPDGLILHDSDLSEVARMFKGETLENFESIDDEKIVVRETDVDRLRAFLHTNKKTKFTGDGSLVILESDDEVQAADYLSSLLATMSDDTDDVVLIRGSSTSFIDQFLTKLNLPVLGGADKSPHRGYMQTLPLALELLWKPFDPQKMVEFLMLPKGPVNPTIAGYFIRSIKGHPGIGSGAWQKAWEDVAERLMEWALKNRSDPGESKEGAIAIETRVVEVDPVETSAAKSDTAEPQDDEPKKFEQSEPQLISTVDANDDVLYRRVAEQLAQLKAWLEPAQLFDAQEGMPTSVILEVCDRVRKHAQMRANTLVDSLSLIQLQVFSITAVYADTLAATVAASQAEFITRSQLLRMIESAMGDGYAPVAPHASPWTPVDHPGQIVDSPDTVIWWGFVDFKTHGFSYPWSQAETEFLSKHGVLLDNPQSFVVREAKSWSRPIDASTKRLMLVKPRTVAGRTVAAHPFFHEIASAFEATPHSVREKFIRQAHQVYTQPETNLLNKTIRSSKVELRIPPSPRPIWKVKAKTFAARVESATSLERLLGCPMSWLLKYQANLKIGNLLSITSGEQLSGILAHAVLGGIFSDEDWQQQGDIEQHSDQLFDELCPKMAAPLLLPGSSLERQRLRKAIGEAAVNLSALIKQAGFSSVVSEAGKNATVDDVALTGQIDLVLKHPDNHDFVIDLKWSRRAPHRRRELSEGRSIQLALYTHLLKRETGIPTSGGYYMISQRQLFSTSKGPFPNHTFVDGPKLDHTFESLLANSKQHLIHLQAGTVYATGLNAESEMVNVVEDFGAVDIVADDEPEERASRVPDITLALEPPCRICDFGRLCGKKGFGS